MRLEKYVKAPFNLAYDKVEYKFLYFPAKDNLEENEEPLPYYMRQELVFFNRYMLYHLSPEDESEPPIFKCVKIYYDHVSEFKFDIDKELLTLSFYNRPFKIYIKGTPDVLNKIYNDLITQDDNFHLSDFSEIDNLFSEYSKLQQIEQKD